MDVVSTVREVGKPIDENSACVEVGKPIDEKSACVEAGTTIFQLYYLRRVVQELDGIVESTDTIVKLKTKIENSSTFESDPDFVKTLIQNCIDERVSQNEREVTSEQKIELAKLQLAKLEKEIELQLAKNKALSLNPAAKVEEKQFETNIENMIKNLSVGTAISPTLTEEFIIHPSVYSEIEKLGHAKSDVLLSENESSLGAHAYAYSSAVSFPNVSVSNVIENSKMICHMLRTLILEMIRVL
ncbi:hypothetical protein TNCV_2100461 [Trichonephila clavipes]|nr:hypothetical protein TNCV_2100461 [Trichonephila clavipes]